MDYCMVTPPTSPLTAPASPTDSEISAFQLLDLTLEQFNVLNLPERDSAPSSPRFPNYSGLSTINEDDEIVPAESEPIGAQIRILPATQYSFIRGSDGIYTVEKSDSNCGVVVPTNNENSPEVIGTNDKNSEDHVDISDNDSGEGVTTVSIESENLVIVNKESSEETPATNNENSEETSTVNNENSGETSSTNNENSQHEPDTPTRRRFTRDNFTECERVDLLDLEQEIRRFFHGAMAKRLITQSNSKITKENVVVLLTYPEAWERLDQQTKIELYETLPTEFDGQRYEYDINQHPLLSPFRKYVSHFLYEWQEDLRQGRLTARWENEAKQASGERAAGDFDQTKDEEKEDWWGQKYDPNFFRGPEDASATTSNAAVADGDGDNADSAFTDPKATDHDSATAEADSFTTPISTSTAVVGSKNDNVDSAVTVDVSATADVAPMTTATSLSTTSHRDLDTQTFAGHSDLHTASLDELDRMIAYQYESLSELETRRDALAQRRAEAGDIPILADLADSDAESFTSEVSEDDD